jgi:glucokinase
MSISLQTSSKNISYAVGIDLGGTYIKSGIADSTGKILKEHKVESFADKSPQKVISQIEKCITALRKGFEKELAGIGIGSAGIVQNGVVKYPPNFKNWKTEDLKSYFGKKYEMEAEVDNDANCAGLAELKFGHGKKYKDFIFLTLGTGIGGAIVIDGKMYKGEKNGAGEFGMTTINFDGPPCLGGNPGAIEAYIGRNYFLENEKKEVKKLGKNIDFDDITKLASKGNKTARKLYKKYGFYLGVALTNYFNLMDVRTCILSGGISNAYKYFIYECNKTIKERALKTIRKEFKVLKSGINNDAGVLGAAALILS